jgi:hypothetical protein
MGNENTVKPVCVTTHRQILDGACPWCDRWIGDGEVSNAPADVSAVRWNWSAVERSLRSDDPEERGLALWNQRENTSDAERILPLLASAILDNNSTVSSMAEDVCRQLGRSLSTDQLAWLERQRTVNGCELAARVMSLGRCRPNENAPDRAADIHWLIRFHPSSHTAGSPFAYLNKRSNTSAYETAKHLWLHQCESENSKSPQVLGNAAKFFLVNEPHLAERLLRQAQSLDPANPRWNERLSHLYSLSARSGPQDESIRLARRSFIELEMAEQIRSAHSLELEDGDELRKLLIQIHTLPRRARAAFDTGEFAVATKFAEECLALAASPQLPDFFQNDGNAIHHGHLVLGRIALRHGDVDRAKNHLIESGKTAGAPNLASFGPNMSLAAELLQRGEMGCVLEYLQLCEEFWSLGGETLASWRAEIMSDRMPDFGANLVY